MDHVTWLIVVHCTAISWNTLEQMSNKLRSFKLAQDTLLIIQL